MLHLTLHHLQGYDLEEMDTAMFGGGSDPYLIVTTDPPSLLMTKQKITFESDGVKSSVIKHSLHPIWKDELDLTLCSIDLDGLSKNASLIISVWDEDVMSADDLIGVMTIPMQAIISALSLDRRTDISQSVARYVFNEAIRCNSEVMGRLSGVISYAGSSGGLRGEGRVFQEIVDMQRSIDDDRYRGASYLPLSRASVEQQHTPGCGCVLN
jgi:hypothetical protein